MGAAHGECGKRLPGLNGSRLAGLPAGPAMICRSQDYLG
ncbi:hypothetical protein ISE1_1091 [plant metagenome]|uniref:Uncharacterized protein n=1 Tax=plant metagenome TaxID=1297885 RepID=A0A484TR33_9ZZZZ